MNTAPAPPCLLSLQPDVPSSQGSSSASSKNFYQHVVPAQRVQRSFESQSQANTDSLLSNDGVPSMEQSEAIAILQNIPSHIIFAWLHGFRSVLRGEQWIPLKNLASEQYWAVSALRDCSDNLVLTWLSCAQSQSQYPQTIYYSQHHIANGRHS